MVDTTPGISSNSGPSINGADPAQEAWERTTTPIDSDVIHRLIYEHLVYNCFSETAKTFGSVCRVSQEIALATKREGKRSGRGVGDLEDGGRATPMEIDDGPAAKMDDEGDFEMDDGEGAHGDGIGAGTSSHGGSGSAGGAVGGLGGIADGYDRTTGPLRTLDARKHLYTLIISGKVSDAIKYCNDRFPQALDKSTPQSIDMCFQMQCQQFIECVRKKLGQFGYLNPKYIEKLQDIVALIAYPNPETSPVAEYLSQQRREEVAMNLNSHILSFDGLPPDTAIERLVRQAVAVRDLVSAEGHKDKKTNKPMYPKWDLQAFIGDTAS
ncbi:hypothetical protein HK104_003742 [Borealophlyctis nickersoniae]|nr:hypothetical protein HK104_003742 [Borealophlyctis nickersoniae]